MPDPSTQTSSFYPDIEQADPKEESEANKRALTLGLLTAGIGILSHPYIKGQSVVAPIAQGLGAGLETYEGSLQEAAKDQLERHKVALDAYKDKIAQERADAYEQHQQDIEKEAGRRDDINQQKADEAERAHTAAEAINQQRADATSQQANTADRRADTAARAESRRFDPVGADSPVLGAFDRFRNIPGMEKYMSVAQPREDLAALPEPELAKRLGETRKEYVNTQKGSVTYFTGADGMRHKVTTDAAGIQQDISLGAVPTPGTDKDAKTKDFTEWLTAADGTKTPWTVSRNMSIPGAPAFNVQPLKGHSYGWIYKDPDSIPKPQDFNALDPSITGRIGSKPGTGTAGPAVAPSAALESPEGKAFLAKHPGARFDPTVGHWVKPKNSGGDAGGSGVAGSGGSGAGSAPRASTAPTGSPKLYTEGGIHRNKATGEYLFKMPDGSWGWGKTPNDPNPRPSAADAVKKAEEARGGAGV